MLSDYSPTAQGSYIKSIKTKWTMWVMMAILAVTMIWIIVTMMTVKEASSRAMGIKLVD
jgi:hypothetical protein